MAFIDLEITIKPVQRVKTPESSARPYLNKNRPHSINEIKTKDYRVIGVTAFLRKLMRLLRKKRVI